MMSPLFGRAAASYCRKAYPFDYGTAGYCVGGLRNWSPGLRGTRTSGTTWGFRAGPEGERSRKSGTVRWTDGGFPAWTSQASGLSVEKVVLRGGRQCLPLSFQPLVPPRVGHPEPPLRHRAAEWRDIGQPLSQHENMMGT